MSSSSPASVKPALRTTKLKLRKRLTQLAASALGLCYALALALPPSSPPPGTPEPVLVSFKAREAPAPTPLVEKEVVAPSAQTAAELPLSTETPAATEIRKEGLEATETEVVAAPTATEQGLKPPAPPDIYAPPNQQFYAEKPGGPVLVMALLVDTDGNVYNAKIVVPSHNSLADLTYLLSAPGLKLGPMKPSFPAGEQRWVEIHVRFSPPGDNLLP